MRNNGALLVAASFLATTLALAAATPVGSQPAPSEPGYIVEQDAAGDVVIEYDRTSQEAPTGSETADILDVWVGNENETHFELGMRMAAWETDDAIQSFSFEEELAVRFVYKENLYRVNVGPYYCFNPSVSLEFLEGIDYYGERWQFISCVTALIDPNAATVSAMVPKAQITDENGLPLRFGQELDGFYGSVRQPVSDGPFMGGRDTTPWAIDRAPDEGLAPPFRFVEGLNGQGKLQLAAVDQARVTTGDATTLSYELFIDNLGSQPLDVAMSVDDLEIGWDARYPATVKVGGGETTSVPVLVSLTASDRRGQTADVVVRGQDASDPDTYSELTITVLWPNVRQPSGQADTLYFHGEPYRYSDGTPSSFPPRCGGGFDCWMNTDAPQAGDYDGPADWYRATSGPDTDSVSWRIPMNPELAVGLNFDLNGTGRFQGTVRTGTDPYDDAQMQARIMYCDAYGTDETSYGSCGRNAQLRLLAYGESVVEDMPEEEDMTFDFLVYPRNESDYLRYHKLAFLYLDVALVMQGNGQYPLFMPNGGRLDLPLLPYTDPVEQAIQTQVGDLALRALGSLEKQANPGNTSVFHFSLANEFEEKRTIELLFEGPDSGWGRWTSSSKVEVAGRDNTTVTMAVDVPETAKNGDTAEIFVVARLKDSPEVATSSRVYIIVTTNVEIPDESRQLTDGSSSIPGPGPAGLITAIGLAGLSAAASRRRR